MLKSETRLLFDSLAGMTSELQAIHQRKSALLCDIIKTFMKLMGHRDVVTGEHVERTKEYLRILVTAMLEQGIYTNESHDWDLDFLFASAQLHDLGKIFVQESVLQKPGKLTEQEYVEIKKHTVLGVLVLDELGGNSHEDDFLKQAKILAGTHHERWDGSGYPYGLRGHDIPLQGRLMAFADVYDALVSERPYKKPFSHEQAVNMVLEGRGTQFDPILTDLFESVSGRFANAAIA